jgi:hypothetical protein
VTTQLQIVSTQLLALTNQQPPAPLTGGSGKYKPASCTKFSGLVDDKNPQRGLVGAKEVNDWLATTKGRLMMEESEEVCVRLAITFLDPPAPVCWLITLRMSNCMVTAAPGALLGLLMRSFFSWGQDPALEARTKCTTVFQGSCPVSQDNADYNLAAGQCQRAPASSSRHLTCRTTGGTV